MKIDFSSSAWLNLREYLEGELTRLRAANDAVGFTAEDRGALLGEIRLCKRILALPEVANREEAAALDLPPGY